MGIEVVIALIGGMLSLLIGGLSEKIINPFYPKIRKLYDKNPDSGFSKFLALMFYFDKAENVSYSQKIEKSLKALKNASLEIDEIMLEFESITKERHARIVGLELKLNELSAEEIELSKKIQALEKVPIEAINHLEKAMNKGERKSAIRDYVLFGLGVVVSIAVSLVLRRFGFN